MELVLLVNDTGSNDWTDSTIMEVLNNGAYYNRMNGLCPSDKNGATIECDFSSNGLTSDAKNQISKVLWNLGGTWTSDLLAFSVYNSERGTLVVNNNATAWTGYIGLTYTSDYGFAVGNESKKNCLETSLGVYNQSDCYTNNWLVNSK